MKRCRRNGEGREAPAHAGTADAGVLRLPKRQKSSCGDGPSIQSPGRTHMCAMVGGDDPQQLRRISTLAESGTVSDSRKACKTRTTVPPKQKSRRVASWTAPKRCPGGLWLRTRPASPWLLFSADVKRNKRTVSLRERTGDVAILSLKHATTLLWQRAHPRAERQNVGRSRPRGWPMNARMVRQSICDILYDYSQTQQNE